MESRITPMNANDADNAECFELVAKHYHQTFLSNPAGREYLSGRGIGNEALFVEHRIGFCDGSLLSSLGKVSIEKLSELGLILENGKERFLGCVVFPLFDKDLRVVSFYGRHLKTGHFYLPGVRQGVFNRGKFGPLNPPKGGLEIQNAPLIISESVIDALSFINAGLPNVLAIYGTNGFTNEHLDLINDLKPSEIVIALDGDEQGQAASLRLKEKLAADCGFSFNCRIAIMPDKQDANEYFQRYSKVDFEKLVGETAPLNPPKVGGDNAAASIPHNATENQASIALSAPRNPLSANYQIKHLEAKAGKLTVTLKVVNPNTKRFVLDTINLYSKRGRDSLVASVAQLFQVKHELIEAEVTELIALAESKSKQLEPEKPEAQTVMTETEKADALTFLKSPKLLSEIVDDYSTLGYIGEESNKQLAYLVMTSRKLDNPLSLVIVSNSAAGKSSLQKATMEFCPPEDGKHFTRLTQQSLYYLGEESLKHKFLSIEEEEGQSDANYSLKTLLSAKVLNVAATTQDPVTGKRIADEYRTEGPVAVMVSTTNPDLEPEFASRTLVISIDETKEQTAQIHDSQRELRTIEGRARQLKEKIVHKKHHNAQRLLDKDLVVVNNLAPKLQFPTDRLKYRRANAHYLDLIDTIAYLRQYQKEIKQHGHGAPCFRYIEVDKSDIKIANNLYGVLMGWQIDELVPPTRKLLIQTIEFCGKKGLNEFSRREIRECYKWGNTHLHNHLQKLVELEYITPITGQQGSKYQYQLLLNYTESDNLIEPLKAVAEL